MSKQHETIPKEPQEAAVQPNKPEVLPPADPQPAGVPQEAPLNEPGEVPQQPNPQPEIQPGQAGSIINRTEV